MGTIEFHQVVAGQQRPWRFGATNMSDGTLRGLGVLIALLQSNSQPPTLVGIEEPEVALHPAAVGIPIDAIRDAALSTQVLVTSHSPELPDRDDIGGDVILAVNATNGITTVGPVDDASHSAIFTARARYELMIEDGTWQRFEPVGLTETLFGVMECPAVG